MSDIETLIAAEDWKAARRAIQRMLRKEPNRHWLVTRLALTYYEQRDYETALAYSEKAMKLAPHCPLVLWDYGGVLDMLGRKREAIQVFRRLVRRGAQSLAYCECGEGIGKARALVADCLYRLCSVIGTLASGAEQQSSSSSILPAVALVAVPSIQ